MPDSMYSRTYNDYSGERGTMTFRIPTLTAANFNSVIGLIASLATKTDQLSLGRPGRVQLSAIVEKLSDLPATDTGAERETKWLIIFEDNVTKRLGQVEIPCAKREDGNGPLTKDNSDDADLAHPAWAGWIAAFQDVARSISGNEVTVVRAKKVGRNL